MVEKKVRIPEAGQWPDKLVLPALAVGAVLTTVGFLMAFLFAAPVNGAALDAPELVGGVMVTHQQLISQKILYFHMPVAIVSFVMLVFAGMRGYFFLNLDISFYIGCAVPQISHDLLALQRNLSLRPTATFPAPGRNL